MADDINLKKLDLKKIPTWVWLVGGGGVIIVVFIILRNNAASSTTSTTGTTTSDVSSLFSGFSTDLQNLQKNLTDSVSSLTATEQADIATLQTSLQNNIATVNSSLTALQSGLAEQVSITNSLSGVPAAIQGLTATTGTIQSQLNAAQATIRGLLQNPSVNYSSLTNAFTLINSELQTLQQEINASALTGLSVQSLIQDAYQNVAAKISYDTMVNGHGVLGDNATIDQVVNYLKTTTRYASNPNAQFLLSLVRSGTNTYGLPTSSGSIAVLPPITTYTVPAAP